MVMSNVVSPIVETDQVCCRYLEEGHSKAWIRLGSEGIELAEIVTFDLGFEGYIGVFQKGEVYADTCHLLCSK